MSLKNTFIASASGYKQLISIFASFLVSVQIFLAVWTSVHQVLAASDEKWNPNTTPTSKKSQNWLNFEQIYRVSNAHKKMQRRDAAVQA